MEQPPPLDYRNSNTPKPTGPSSAPIFMFGLVAGSTVSGLIWPAVWHSLNDNGWVVYLLIIVPCVKIVGGAVCMVFPTTKHFGVGLLVSIALGALIFFGTCAANLKI